MSDSVDSVVRLELLHEHFKESFALIRERERQRDRLLLVIIGLYAGLILAIGYPAEFKGSVGTISVFGTEVSVGAIPAAALLSALWVITSVIVLRYCQLCVKIERDYAYLHPLETKIGSLLGDATYFCREGFAYQDKYPPLLNLAWIVYGYAVPLIFGFATVALMIMEWTSLLTSVLHKSFDGAMALGVVLILVSYRLYPAMKQTEERIRNWFSSK